MLDRIIAVSFLQLRKARMPLAICIAVDDDGIAI